MHIRIILCVMLHKTIQHLLRKLCRRRIIHLWDRAAQFAPFAALTGHDAALKETARLTDEKLELSEEVIAQRCV